MSLMKFYLLSLKGVGGLYQDPLETVVEKSVSRLFCTTNINIF